MNITVHTTPICQQCNLTKKMLDRYGAAYEVIDLTEDAEAREFVIVTLGHKAAPIVTVRDEDGELLAHWSGFRPDMIGIWADGGKAA